MGLGDRGRLGGVERGRIAVDVIGPERAPVPVEIEVDGRRRPEQAMEIRQPVGRQHEAALQTLHLERLAARAAQPADGAIAASW